MEDGHRVDGSLFFFAPNHGAAIFFTIAFGISTFFHLWQTHHYSSWKITTLLPFGCAIFAAGFGVRAYCSWHYSNLTLYITQFCLIYAAPPLLELQNYHTLGRLLAYVPYHTPLHPRRVLTMFGLISFVVEALNGIGASYSANQKLPQSKINVGYALSKASLIIQLFVLPAFATLVVIVHRRCYHSSILRSNINRLFIILYISTLLLLTRTIYRVVEYFDLTTAMSSVLSGDVEESDISITIRYEWFFYVFEASLMLANVLMLNIFHPRRFLPHKHTIYLARDGNTEMDGPGWEDKRPFVITLLDPFDVGGCFGRKEDTNMFWETDGIHPLPWFSQHSHREKK